MRTFKEHIKENRGSAKTAASVGTPVSDKSAEDGNIGAHNIHDEDVLKVVNGFVGSIGNEEYINPQHAVDKLREKLERVGLSFDCKLVGETGKQTVEVRRFGGRYGKTGEEAPDEVVNDDGISHMKEGGVKLEVEHDRISNGSFKVYAKLI